MNNATVALRESHKWIRFKIPFPVIRSSIGMLYTSAALPRYRSQSAMKPVKDYDFKEPERLASVNTHQVQMWGKGRRTKRQSWPLLWYRWSQHSLALPSVLWLDGGLYPQLLSQCQHNSLWGLDRSLCQWLSQNRHFEKTQGSLVSQINHWVLGAGSVITNCMSLPFCMSPSRGEQSWILMAASQPFSAWTCHPFPQPVLYLHSQRPPGRAVSAEATLGTALAIAPERWPGRAGSAGGTSALGWGSQGTIEPASDRAPSDVMLSIQEG